MPDPETPQAPPTVEKVVETKETTKASTEAAAAQVISPAPAIVADDGARWWLAFAVIIQFLVVIGFIIYRTNANETNNAEMMILGAEIGFVTTVLNYFFGSSSGSTAKSALLEKSKP